MKRIAIYNHYEGCGKSLIASLLAYWLENEKKANVILQVFDINAGPDVCDVVERESEGDGYYVMDFLWDDRIPIAFRHLLKKGLVDYVIMPVIIDVIQSCVRTPFTYSFLTSGRTYEVYQTKRPNIFCLWNRVPNKILYDENSEYLNRESFLVKGSGLQVCSTRLMELPSLDFASLLQSGYCKAFDEVKERIDLPNNPKWRKSWIEELDIIKELPPERRLWLYDKLVENGLLDETFTIPLHIDPKTGKPIVLPPDPSDEEAYEAFWNKDKS